MNSINCPASSVWVFIAQLGEHCSANAEATGSNPVEAPKIFFSGYFRNCLNCDSLRWSHTHFTFLLWRTFLVFFSFYHKWSQYGVCHILFHFKDFVGKRGFSRTFSNGNKPPPPSPSWGLTLNTLSGGGLFSFLHTVNTLTNGNVCGPVA